MKRTRNRRNGSKKPQQQGVKPVKAVVRAAQRVSAPVSLDKAAVEWAALLKDPCNARLVYPCYPNGTGSTVLMRLESDTIVANSATEVAAFGYFVPGLGLHLQNSTPLTSDTLGSNTLSISALCPGATFLGTNVTSQRAVAACVQISYPGTELNRSGIVGMGVVPADLARTSASSTIGGGAFNASAASVRTACQHVERMPSTLVECKWFPGERDAESFDPQVFPSAEQGPGMVGRNAIAWSCSGFPVSTGIRVRTVVVYELSFGTGGNVQGVVPPPSVANTSSILRALYNKDPQWYIDSAVKIAKGVSATISYARQGAKLAGQVMSGIGMLAI
jgi:hypothetical protein